MVTVIQKLATTIIARKNCIKSGNDEWVIRHFETIKSIDEMLPSGGGFDNACQIDEERSSAQAVYIETSFHHMNGDGFYDGWTNHTLKIVPTFDGFDFSISGPNRNEIKDYIGDVFSAILGGEYVEPPVELVGTILPAVPAFPTIR